MEYKSYGIHNFRAIPRIDRLNEEKLLKNKAPEGQIIETADRIRFELNTHPAGQMEKNVPGHMGRRLEGVQHKYRETLLYFPSQGQTCHAYF